MHHCNLPGGSAKTERCNSAPGPECLPKRDCLVRVYAHFDFESCRDFGSALEILQLLWPCIKNKSRFQSHESNTFPGCSRRIRQVLPAELILTGNFSQFRYRNDRFIQL